MDYVQSYATMEIETSHSVEVMISPVADRKTSMTDSTLGIFKQSFSSQNESPALVSVDSGSESDGSSDDEEVAGGPLQSSPEVLPASAAPSETLTNAGDGMEPADCLSDKFTSFFCPFDQADEHPVNGEVKKGPSKSRDSDYFLLNSTCTEFQLEDILNAASSPGAELLASFQCWLKPTDEKFPSSVRPNQNPQNRSGSRKMRSNYIKQLRKNWYPEREIPMSRTKSTSALPASPSSDSLMDLCYDSDPGDENAQRGKATLESTLDTRQQSKKRSYKDRRPASIGTGFGNMDRGFFCPSTPRSAPYKILHPPTPRHSDRNSSFFDEVPPSLSERDLLRPDKQAYVKNIVQIATNGRTTLTWHRQTAHPISVVLHFEVGAHLDNNVVQPKLIWSPNNEPDLKNRKVRVSCAEPESLELLSIIRVKKLSLADRKLYPFARLNSACCITATDHKQYVFEADSTERRDWLMDSIKLVVARLASIIIVRDEEMLVDFFSPFSGLEDFMEEAEEDTAEERHTEQCDTPLLIATDGEARERLWGTR